MRFQHTSLPWWTSTRHRPQDFTNHVVCCTGTLWTREDVYVIKVCHHKVSGRKPVLDFFEGGGKGDAEEPRHEGIP